MNVKGKKCNMSKQAFACYAQVVWCAERGAKHETNDEKPTVRD